MNVDKKEFDKVTGWAGFKSGNKGLYKYINGRSPVFKEFLHAIKDSHTPAKHHIPMACYIMDRWANGDFPNALRKLILNMFPEPPEEHTDYDHHVSVQYCLPSGWRYYFLKYRSVRDEWYSTVKESTKKKYSYAVELLDIVFNY